MKKFLILILVSLNVFAVDIEIVSLKGFGKSADARFRKIAANTQKVINSEAFKKEVEGWYFQKKNQFKDTTDSPKVVYQKIMAQNWKLEYRMEWLWARSTIGYTLPDVSWIVFNSRRFGGLEDADISGNICHEYGGHKLGRYDHSLKPNPERPYSVPYGLGYLCGMLYRKFFP